jgi:hypothetical protein
MRAGLAWRLRAKSIDRPPTPDPDGVAPEIPGGYGDGLDPAAMFPRTDAPAPVGIWRTRSGLVIQTGYSVSLHPPGRCAIGAPCQ